MITLNAITKRFGRFVALDGVDLSLRDGELLALLGPSGSGKTTLLRVIAGLEVPDAGEVAFDGEKVTRVPATDRGVGFVFQHYALFRHMTVGENIAFGLDVKGRDERPGKGAIAAKVHALLDLVALPGMADRRPGELSGGQRQRVALARALAVDPRILLLDEPFGALDVTVRRSLRKELRRIHDATGVTTLFVTHDQDEALELADQVAVLKAGRIEQVGTPGEVLSDGARIAGEVSGGVFRGGGMEIAANGVADGPAAARVRLEST